MWQCHQHATELSPPPYHFSSYEWSMSSLGPSRLWIVDIVTVHSKQTKHVVILFGSTACNFRMLLSVDRVSCTCETKQFLVGPTVSGLQLRINSQQTASVSNVGNVLSSSHWLQWVRASRPHVWLWATFHSASAEFMAIQQQLHPTAVLANGCHLWLILN